MGCLLHTDEKIDQFFFWMDFYVGMYVCIQIFFRGVFIFYLFIYLFIFERVVPRETVQIYIYFLLWFVFCGFLVWGFVLFLGFVWFWKDGP